MAKKVEQKQEKRVERESIRTAKALGLACMEADQFELLQKMLAPFGVKYDATPIRSNAYKGAKEALAIKVKISGFTCLVSRD
jgi:hypothetical protein